MQWDADPGSMAAVMYQRSRVELEGRALRALAAVPDTTVQAYHRDGAVVLRGLLSVDEVERLRRGIDRCIEQPSRRSKVASAPDDPGWFFEDFCTWQDVPEFERVLRTSALAAAAARLMRSETARLFHDHVLVKEPGTVQRTPWHQDQPYYNVEGSQNVSFWIPVDPVPRAWTLEFVAGSHRGPWRMPRSFLDQQAKWFPEGSLQELPDVEADRSAYDIIGWPLELGDAVAFNMLTLHAAAGVPGPQRRRVYSVRFLGDDMVHAPRPWPTSPDFPGLDEELPAGAAMDHHLFPVLWPG